MTEILPPITDEMQSINHAFMQIRELQDMVCQEMQGERALPDEWEHTYKELRRLLGGVATFLSDVRTDPTLIETSRVKYIPCVLTDRIRDNVMKEAHKITDRNKKIIFEESSYQNQLEQLYESRYGERIQPDREYLHSPETVEEARLALGERQVV